MVQTQYTLRNFEEAERKRKQTRMAQAVDGGQSMQSHSRINKQAPFSSSTNHEQSSITEEVSGRGSWRTPTLADVTSTSSHQAFAWGRLTIFGRFVDRSRAAGASDRVRQSLATTNGIIIALGPSEDGETPGLLFKVPRSEMVAQGSI